MTLVPLQDNLLVLVRSLSPLTCQFPDMHVVTPVFLGGTDSERWLSKSHDTLIVL